MTAAVWIAVVGVGVTVLVNLIGYAVAWGILKTTVGTLKEEVEDLRDKVDALSDLHLKVVKIETRLDALLEQFKDLNASIRWMREPAAYDKMGRPG